MKLARHTTPLILLSLGSHSMIFCYLLCIKRRIVNSLFYKSFKELDPHTNFEYLVVSCYKTLDITKKNCGGHIIMFKSQALKMVLYLKMVLRTLSLKACNLKPCKKVNSCNIALPHSKNHLTQSEQKAVFYVSQIALMNCLQLIKVFKLFWFTHANLIILKIQTDIS